MSHFRKALAPLRSAHQHAGSPQHLEYHAHMSTTYTDIFYIRSIYKYINIYKYISIMCSCRPRSLSLAQLWEAGGGGSPHHVPGQPSGEHGKTAQEGGAEKWSWGASASPVAQCSTFLPLYKQERKERSSLPSVVAHTCNPSRNRRGQDTIAIASSRSGGPYPVSTVMSRLARATQADPVSNKIKNKIWLPSPSQGFG